MWRWEAPHPEWIPEAAPESPADWPEQVGSVAYAAPEAFLLVDPLVPDDLWEPLGEKVDVHGMPVVVVTTIRFHRRSRDAVLRRFGATAVRRPADLPEGVETIRIPRAGETMVWLPGPRALVPGDRLLGDGRGRLRLCPPRWLRYLQPGLTHDELREALRPLLDLPVELVLVSHGEPVLQNGRAAIEQALS
ncbi:MAG TPA: hypothetical protein VH281_07880 [Gaiellaceae bacterium]